ncbi:hypothetical protein IGI04_018441 [Brassica rapa subsp. trilocularis]|uniref:DUF4283 domain-containing protein n=1 Tax=Brassica rapa subsp. trilocularis TaxID=1813537 RepID=A0ABQ7MDF8_BRACM|nr:hypothetical protein IGI04_018441 [Brassica rapa subsp. trilocularis]
MENPWFPFGSASAFSPPLDTAGDSCSPVPPHPPDPPDPSSPFPVTHYPPLSLSSSKTSRRSQRTAMYRPVEKVSGTPPPTTSNVLTPSTTGVAAATSADPETRSGTVTLISRSESTVAGAPASESFTIFPPKETSPTVTNKASVSSSKDKSPALLQNTIPIPKLNPPSSSLQTIPLLSYSSTEKIPLNRSIPPGPSLVERLRKSEDKTLTRLAPISLSDSGRPRVLIPDSVFQKGAEMHKDFIVCHFNGRPPPFNQIQSVLNHMWGKGKKIEIHNNLHSRSMLVRIPSDYLRQKILEKNVWYVGDSMFHASQWSSNGCSAPREAIQIWAHLTGVPLDLRYKEEVKLSEPLPRVVEFVRQSGEVVEVQVDYPWVPPTCGHCKELGHISRNCLLLPPPSKKNLPSSKKVLPPAPKTTLNDASTSMDSHPVAPSLDPPLPPPSNHQNPPITLPSEPPPPGLPPTPPSDYQNPPHLSSETLPPSSSLATFSPNIASPPLTFSSSEAN